MAVVACGDLFECMRGSYEHVVHGAGCSSVVIDDEIITRTLLWLSAITAFNKFGESIGF
jgi:hypothetical protein